MNRRRIIQVIFLALFLGILARVIVTGEMAIHNICPYALVCFGALKGNIINLSLGLFALGILIGIVFFIVAMFWGRIFCGYICPVGTTQELVYRLRGKKCRPQISQMYERKLSKLKYWLLGINLLMVIAGISWIYMNFCPIYGLSRLPSVAVGGMIILALIIIGGFFVHRLWCRWLCPYGAILNIAQYLGRLLGVRRPKIHRNLERCIDCGLCSKNCPMNLDILSEEYLQSPNCIHCLTCMQKCPKPGTISKKREQ